ncbi:DUF748 domain-containing protein [Chitinophaga varians]|uniref:DUF748 domain-containing protein n=1 Tax=Chitinophaga varians TaxID=2202339 RepID=UPI00165F4CCD|nr:DUF748 domain-containing protein [Chitinophaga varians]MBC9908996.1 DUF748 domain-containing protein [Chitinophaga varians]
MLKSLKISGKWRMLLYGGVGLLFILVIANVIINRIVQHKVSETLQHLSPGLKVSFSAINSNVLTAVLSLDSVIIDYTPDSSQSQHQHMVRFSAVELTGISFMKMLFRRTLSINDVQLSKVEVNLDEYLLKKKDNLGKQLFDHTAFNSISVNHFTVNDLRIWESTRLLLKGNISIDEINIRNVKQPFTADNFHIGAVRGNLSDINYTLPNAYHTLTIKQLTIDSRQQTLQINSMKLVPQYPPSEFFQKTDNQPLYVALNIADLTLLQVDMPKLLDKKLVAGKITLNKSAFNIYYEVSGAQPTLSRSFLFIDLQKTLSVIQTDLFSMNRSSIAYGSTTGDQLKLNGNIETHQLNIRTTDTLSGRHDIHFKTLACALNDIHAVSSGSYQHLHIKQLNIDHKGTLQATSLKISPQYDKFEVGKKAGHQIDVVDATISGITITQLDMARFFRQEIIAEQIWIKESNVYIFRDRRLPRPSRYKPLPVAFLKSIPTRIRVHQLKVSSSTLSYEELPKDGPQTGLLKVEKLQASLSPLINHPSPSDPDHMDLRMEGSLMGSGTVKTTVYLPFAAGKDYYVSGAFDNLDLTTLNSAAENLGHFHIESGLLNNLTFQFSLNDEKSTGKVVGSYHQLVVEKLKGASKKVAGFPTFMLKHVIIPKNKDASLPVARRTGAIDYKFDHTRSLSFYFLKSLLSGIDASFTFGFLLPK